MLRYADLFLLTLMIAACLTPILRRMALRLGILDHPKQHGIHERPVARIGGVAIYLAFVAGTLYRMDLSDALKGVLVGSTMVFLTGFLDDTVRLRASVKLAVQVLACSIMMFRYEVILHVFPNVFWNGFFTALGIIGITNAVNFLDNMDGLAAGLVTISTAAIFWVALSTKQTWLVYLSVSLAGAAVGFLVWNLKKAHVFMGDAGANFLGFTLASLAVMTEWSSHRAVTLAVPILILGVPILDMFLITVLRAKENKVKNFKQWIDYTGKDHLSHRLMRLGLGQRGAVFSLWGFQFLFCLLALVIYPRGDRAGLAGLITFLMVTGGVIVFFRKRRAMALHWNGRPLARRRFSDSRPAVRQKGKVAEPVGTR